MENLLQFAKDLSTQKALTKHEIAKSSIEDWLEDLEDVYPQQTQLIRDILDTIKE